MTLDDPCESWVINCNLPFTTPHSRRGDRSKWIIVRPNVPSGLCISAAINNVRRRLWATDKNDSNTLSDLACARQIPSSPFMGSLEIDYSALDSFEPIELLRLPETQR
jgi:hypothetical protein